MRRLTIEALRAGALGSPPRARTLTKTPVGEMVPSRYAASEELGIGSALGAVGAGASGMTRFRHEPQNSPGWTQLARETGRPCGFLLTDRYDDPARWRRLLTGAHARGRTGRIDGTDAGRPIGS